jgi:hypothetical protein
MKQPTFIPIIGVISLVLIFFMATTIAPTYAGIPAEPHKANAMWIEPSSISFTPANATVGTKFNVTVAMNITKNVYVYSIGIQYNRTQIKATRAAFTEPPTSNYFTGHTTTASGPVIDTSYLGNGSVLASESCSGTDYIPGPNNGTLIWVEFQFLQAPIPGGTLVFNMSRYLGSSDTGVSDELLVSIAITVYDATYPIVPEFYALILPAFLALTALAVILGKTVSKKKVT